MRRLTVLSCTKQKPGNQNHESIRSNRPALAGRHGAFGAILQMGDIGVNRSEQIGMDYVHKLCFRLPEPKEEGGACSESGCAA